MKRRHLRNKNINQNKGGTKSSIREAAKNVCLVAWPLRGGGEGLATKKINIFFKL